MGDMEKIKWRYYKSKRCYVLQSKIYKYHIEKDAVGFWGLYSGSRWIATFRKLSSAKKVVELLING